MCDMRLGECDYRFMLLLWEHEPIASGDLVPLCEKEFGWKKSTTYTVLRKMCQKGLAQNKETIVTVLVPKERVQAYASDRFVENTFSGSLPHFLLSFLDSKELSEQEAAELKSLIDAHRRKEP